MDVDSHIKRIFNIHAGVRTKAEDEKLLEKVRAHVLDEIVEFIKDSLKEKERRLFFKEFASFKGEEDEAEKLIAKYLNMIPNSKSRLGHRLDSFLTNLYLSSSSDEAPTS